MPLTLRFTTCWLKFCSLMFAALKIFSINFALSLTLSSCGLIPVAWHSIEQTPADSVAYIRGEVIVIGEHLRSATIAKIDNKVVTQQNNNLIEIDLGKHQVTIDCKEANGEFNSLELEGESKVLELNAQLQRTYLVRCKPYSHWWIEDLDSKTIVSGKEFN